jgi:branched-chain amino acid transport system ATP-binding protein
MTPDSSARLGANLRVEAVTVDFQGIRAVDGVSLHVSRGEILGLIGPNGAGKTTLINVLTGFQAVSAGDVWLSGRVATSWPAWRRARAGLSRTFQNVLLFPRMSVIENVESGALALGESPRSARARAHDVLAWLGLSEWAHQTAGTLPFGAERRVGIGRAIASRPRFLLMDEPAAGLNDAECDDLAGLVRRIRAELGCGIIFIEHRMSLVFGLCDRVQVLDLGRTIACASPDAVRNDPAVRKAYLGDPE